MFTRAELSQFSIPRLRNLDIKTKEEEDLVQDVLNSKLKHQPIENPITATSGETDNMTPEKEKELQSEIDAKNEAKKKKLVPEENTEVAPSVTEEAKVTEPQVSQETPVDTTSDTNVEKPKRGRPRKN